MEENKLTIQNDLTNKDIKNLINSYPRKYLNNISVIVLSTNPRSDNLKYDFNNKYLNILITSSPGLPIVDEYLSFSIYTTNEKSTISFDCFQKLSSLIKIS